MNPKTVTTHKSILKETTRSSIHLIEKKLNNLKMELVDCSTQIEKALKQQTH